MVDTKYKDHSFHISKYRERPSAVEWIGIVLMYPVLLVLAPTLFIFTMLFIGLMELCGGQWSKYIDEWEEKHAEDEWDAMYDFKEMKR